MIKKIKSINLSRKEALVRAENRYKKNFYNTDKESSI